MFAHPTTATGIFISQTLKKCEKLHRQRKIDQNSLGKGASHSHCKSIYQRYPKTPATQYPTMQTLQNSSESCTSRSVTRSDPIRVSLSLSLSFSCRTETSHVRYNMGEGKREAALHVYARENQIKAPTASGIRFRLRNLPVFEREIYTAGVCVRRCIRIYSKE